MTTAKGEGVIVGAITNGNGDPRHVPLLSPLFDFCINSETIGHSKPSKEIYHSAIKHVRSLRPKGHFPEKVTGDWWVHVGDDLKKDCEASKGMGMRTVWCKELLITKSESGGGDEGVHIAKEAEKEIKSGKLFDSKGGGIGELEIEACDAVIDEFKLLLDVIEEFGIRENKRGLNRARPHQ